MKTYSVQFEVFASMSVTVEAEDEESAVTRAPADETHRILKPVVERKRELYLWVAGDTPAFRPALSPIIYGDGRALFTLSTINQRPRYWVIRGCSTWGSGMDIDESTGLDFGELTDELLSDLEDSFGNGRCGYSGTSLFIPRRERMRWCKCDECSEKFTARWPMVDGYGGCSWSRMNWPAGFESARDPRGMTLLNPAAPQVPQP